MKLLRHLLMLAAFIFGTGSSFSQGDRCGSIKPFCAGTTEYVFANSSRAGGALTSAEAGINYGCLESQPYPAWFYLKIDTPGNLNFQIKQTVNPDGTGTALDVDFIAWGPFREDQAICNSSTLTLENSIACSYSPSAVENFSINNAVEGEIYIVLITNFSEARGFISLQQTNTSQANAGNTDCEIVNILGEDQQVCANESFELIAENVVATSYEWYIFDDASGTFRLIPGQSGDRITVSESGRFRVISINSNTNTRLSDEVEVGFFDIPIATVPEDLLACSNGEMAIFNLNLQRDQLIANYVDTGEEFELDFYLSEADIEAENPISNPSAYEGRDQQVIWATITDRTSGCTSNPVNFNLKIAALEIVNFKETTTICIDENGNLLQPVSIGEDLGSGFTYQWTPSNDPDGDGLGNPIFIINEVPLNAGISLVITDNESGCSTELFTEVQTFSAPREVAIEIEGNDFDGGYIVTANPLRGIGEETTYQYQLDSGPFQISPEFTDVPPGNHTITAREINGCGSKTSEVFVLIGYPRFFTPNSDGYNDTWNIINHQQGTISSIQIFDRYGKLLKQIDPSSAGWDGTYANKLMPAEDYWFSLEYTDPVSGETTEFKGHFSLIR